MTNNRRLKKGEIIKKILFGVGGAVTVVGVTAILIALPGIGLVLKEFADWYKKQNPKRQYFIKKSFEKLRRQRLIEMKETKRGTRIILTESGRKKILEFNLDDLKVLPKKKWDGRWRMVIFDIPENFKKVRHPLREKFKEWRFLRLQKSVWLWPHECRNEIDFLIEFWRISPYVRLVEVLRFDGDEFAKEHFDLD